MLFLFSGINPPVMRTFCLTLCFCVYSFLSCFAQKLIALPPELQTIQPLQVDFKMKGHIYPYQFGPYKLVDAKKEWTKTEEKKVKSSSYRALFESDGKKTEKDRSSFVMQGPSNQSVPVNIAVTKETEFSRMKVDLFDNKKGEKVFGNSNTLYLASFMIDTTRWDVEVKFTEGGEFTFENDFVGMIEANGKRYLLESVFDFEDGKKRLSGFPIGTVVRYNNKAVAALQFQGHYFSNLKKHSMVWLANELDEQTKFGLAIALTALMSKAHQGLMEQPSTDR